MNPAKPLFLAVILAVSVGHAADKSKYTVPHITDREVASPFVRLQSKSGCCSGVVIGKSYTRVRVLTCAHCKKPGERFFVYFRSPDYVSVGKVAALDTKRDLAFVDVDRVGKPVHALPLRSPKAPRLKPGEKARMVGFPLDYYQERQVFVDHPTVVAEPIVFRELGQELTRTVKTGRPGQSGGPIIAYDELVGIHLRGGPMTRKPELYSGYYVDHLQIWQFIKENQ
ncbi:MAG: S1 family peptidase [Acidiferrobacteraceae bacterium]